MQCEKKEVIKIIVKNPINITRRNETIELTKSEIKKIAPELSFDSLQVVNSAGEITANQKIDRDDDGQNDIIIFQTDMKAGETKSFKLKSEESREFPTKTYARFVPERKNDFAWENDRIAYRMYSKKLEKEENVDSGIDVWTKRVSDLIIDKWYKHGDYHTDNGEGLDFYKVGPSRGCGSLALLKNGKMYGFGGYTDWKIITNGPIRSTFELSYAPIEIDGKQYRETKRISLDAGWNMNRIKSKIDTEDEAKIAIGLAIHEDQEQGSVKYNGELGYVSFWEPAAKSNGHLGTGIVIGNEKYLNGKKIENHHAIKTSVRSNGTVCYYAGAGWDKSKHFTDQDSWNKYIKNIALRINNPVKVKLR
jgi:hypothetical protein